MEALFNNPIDINKAIQQQLFPTILMWNRLEGRPRTHNFDKALKAEVRDALWMLCKQWQMGEFKGEDAGSPVFSRIKINSSKLNEYTLGNGSPQPIDNNLPLEALVEQKMIPMERNASKISLDIRLQLGKYWVMLLKKDDAAKNYIPKYIQSYGFSIPAKERSTDYIYPHKEELQQWLAISGRCIDGYEIIKTIYAGDAASKDIVLDDPYHQAIIEDLGGQLVKYFENNFAQPFEGKDAWLPDRIEYKASLADNSSNKNNLSAEEYYHGRLDWYAFNLEADNLLNGNAPHKDTFIPANVEFEGMPDKRWWKFEDHKTSFGDVTPSTTDLSKLLLIEFGLTFANDWFLVPFDLPIGSIAEIQGLTVTNNFGDNIWIEATEKVGSTLTDWSIFRQTSKESNKKLLLCPSAIKVQESNPIEEIWLIRDEMANMVWGIEKVVPSSVGKGVQGAEYAIQKRQYHEKIAGITEDNDFVSTVYYKAMTDVPENWIPFIPVHADGHKRQIQLQRSSILRIIDGDTLKAEKIKPLTNILREGLENKPKPLTYLIHEEEVTRAGTKVIQGFQRTRWLDGSVFVWFGAKKKTGRGEGNSGLAFDQLETVKNK